MNEDLRKALRKAALKVADKVEAGKEIDECDIMVYKMEILERYKEAREDHEK